MPSYTPAFPAPLTPPKRLTRIEGNDLVGLTPAPINPAKLPLEPSSSWLPTVKIPDPPKLDPNDCKKAWFAQLFTAYAGAVRAYSGQERSDFQRAAVERSRDFPKICLAAEALIEHGIAPAEWAAFSCYVWQKHFSKKSPPPMKWVFLESRVQQRQGWFDRDASEMLSGHVSIPPTYRELYERWRGMYTEIMIHGPRDYKPHVDRWFPTGLYDRLVSKVRREADSMQRSLAERVARGEWVWR